MSKAPTADETFRANQGRAVSELVCPRCQKRAAEPRPDKPCPGPQGMAYITGVFFCGACRREFCA